MPSTFLDFFHRFIFSAELDEELPELPELELPDDEDPLEELPLDELDFLRAFLGAAAGLRLAGVAFFLGEGLFFFCSEVLEPLDELLLLEELLLLFLRGLELEGLVLSELLELLELLLELLWEDLFRMMFGFLVLPFPPAAGCFCGGFELEFERLALLAALLELLLCSLAAPPG